MWGFGDLIDSLDGLSSVVDGGLVHMTNLAESVGNAGEGNHQTHYWALRQQARAPFLGVALRWQGRRVVAPLWWWGVVFDSWIVVASI